MRSLIISILALSLVGCFGVFKKSPINTNPVVLETVEIHVPEDALEPCSKLELAGYELDPFAMSYLYLVHQYGECALKQQNSIEIIKKLIER